MTAKDQPFEIIEKQVGERSYQCFRNAPETLQALWASTAAFADADYLVFEGERVSYKTAHQYVLSISAWMQSEGIQPGDHVAIAMRNYPEWMLAYWAITSIGAVVVGMNSWWVADEMAYALEDAAPKLLICDEERYGVYLDARGENFCDKLVMVRGGSTLPETVTPWAALLDCAAELESVDIDPLQGACIFYTSGTTGKPKGARLSHLACCQNVMAVLFSNASQEALSVNVAETGNSADSAPVQPATIVTAPLFHVTANNCIAQGMTIAGGKLVLMQKWSADETINLLKDEEITSFSGVAVMLRDVVTHPRFNGGDYPHLLTFAGGGSAVHPSIFDVVSATTQALPTHSYGMTETAGIVSSNKGKCYEAAPASVGLPSPTFTVKCIGGEGEALAPGEIGEICFYGPQLFSGYLNRAEATRDAFLDGWLRSGDMGYLDSDGFVYLVDRAKDIVIRGGENIFCGEIEEKIENHADVIESVVFAVPDERMGEEVGIALYLQPEKHLDLAVVRDYLSVSLAKYKLPSYLWLVDQPFPRNAAGKIIKKQVRETCLDK